MHSTKHLAPHPPTIRISVGGIYFNDILVGRFVMSQHPEKSLLSKRAVVQSS